MINACILRAFKGWDGETSARNRFEGLRTGIRWLLKHWCSFRGEQRREHGVGGVYGFFSPPCITVAAPNHCAKKRSHSLYSSCTPTPSFSPLPWLKVQINPSNLLITKAAFHQGTAVSCCLHIVPPLCLLAHPQSPWSAWENWLCLSSTAPVLSRSSPCQGGGWAVVLLHCPALQAESSCGLGWWCSGMQQM